MTILDFGVEVIAISASGVLAPGPLFFSNLLYGARQGSRSGIKVAYGHTLVELPLIVVLAAGLFTSATVNQWAGAIGVVGGVVILGFAAFQVRGAIRAQHAQTLPSGRTGKCPFVAGIALTALNPFFLVWWFTAGLKLIVDSASFGFVAGIAILFAAHIWMDYAWLAGTAFLASKGRSVLKSKYYSLLRLALAAILLYYGVHFTLSGIAGLS
jgi:threonine/homoserine/homoserine lactone efflux protein